MEASNWKEIGPRNQVKLSYVIYDVSSVCGDFSGNHILEDKPHDQKSRWLSDGSKPPQYIMLRLLQPALVHSIVFGKFEKSHPCNIQKLEIYGGLDPDHTQLLLEGGLKNDSIPEVLTLWREAEGMPVPCQYIRIVPLQSWGGSFNFSVWHIQLWGLAAEPLVHKSTANLKQLKEKEAVRLCLKYLRQHGHSDAFQALQRSSQVTFEHSLLTQLYEHLVTEGNFEQAERLICSAVEEGHFDDYLFSQPIKGQWYLLRTMSSAAHGGVTCGGPDMRGGHQMCVDSVGGQIYLYGGWGGSKDLEDLWKFSTASSQWICMSGDTAQIGGPGARSGHCMCYDEKRRVLYVTGRYTASVSMFELHQPQGDLYEFHLDTERWEVLSSNTQQEGGPHLIYNHQMQCDSEAGLVFVLGGKIVGTEMCSGLYVYSINKRQWHCVCPDQTSVALTNQITLPRSSHVMLIHPVLQQLFILCGQRQKVMLSDMLKYDIKSGEVSSLTAAPVEGVSVCGTLSVSKHSICLFDGLSETSSIKSCSVWLYNILIDQWTPVKASSSSPMPRIAHSVVLDVTSDNFYLFGGCPADDSHGRVNQTMRLDDFWRYNLVNQTRESLLRKCQLSLRKLRYLELSQHDPVQALTYLQTSVAALVNHCNEEESQQYRELTAVLFDAEQCSVESVSSEMKSYLKRRNKLYNELAIYFPKFMTQPKDCISNFIKI